MSYQGWTNYETWTVKIWLDIEESSYRYWNDSTRDGWEDAAEDENTEDGTWTRSETARFRLADRLKDEITDGSPVADAMTMYGDLMDAALSEVNWQEIADALLEDYESDGYESQKYSHAD